MADKKISELTNITGANLADTDEFVVVDTSANETKAITYAELKKINGDVDVTGTVTADGLTVDGDITATGGDVDLDTLDLAAIAASKAVTAVDVFVYDTSKDSDGGAWRKRTQHTSWYNETLNTATRGSRREFPAVAVIVAESNQVTIYDGDDPDMPMWMVFDAIGWNRMIYGYSPSDPIKTVSAANGVFVAATGNGTSDSGLSKVNFVSDSGMWYRSGTRTYNGDISKRNAGLNTSALDASGGIVNNSVNDVAMTVLPDAPIDPATGLQVPTIAVATDGGVSVIKDDGTVVDSASSLTMGTVNFDDDNGLWYSRNVASHLLWYSTSSDYEAGDGFGDPVADDASNSYSFPLLTRTNRVAVASEIYIGGSFGAIGYAVNGLMLHQPNYTDQSKGMSAFLTSTYNTGWMNGNIKGAFLSDTDDTDLVGSGELVTNGDFGTGDLTGWTDASFGTGTAVYNSGGVDLTRVDVNNEGQIRQALTTVSGSVYVVSYDRTSGTNGRLWIGTGTSGSDRLTLGEFIPTATNNTATFRATGSTTYLLFNVGANGTTVRFDNISVKLADADRSVNNNGLIVNGTVTRSPVATGAELVAYSGFSASNYLEQPYNADLDFGTGDFCVMGWMRQSTIASAQIVDRGNADRVTGTGRITLLVNTGGSAGFQFFTRDGSGTGRSVSVGSLPAANVWHHVCGVRVGGIQRLYVNGVEVGTAVANTADLSNAAANVYVGQAWDGTNSNNGSLALLRISATAPTAEQIKKIYEDEKVLFQENAACTLYGASDAVTALAHDSDTGLLHVGTSAGRSVFQGLRRVSNTTTAVGTAISASNGLVVEE